MPTRIQLKRAYEEPSRKDGLRILVERLWPRGLSKEQAQLSAWCKQIAPSPELRKWFGHDPQRWAGFQTRYKRELRDNSEAVAELRRLIRGRVVTFIYAARDEQHNGALVLKQFLEAK